MSGFNFVLPDVGEGIAEAEIIEWLVAVGDTVAIDQPIAVLETDKSQIEMPTPVAGRVTALAGKPGEVLRVGAVLITIEVDGGGVGGTALSGHAGAAGHHQPGAIPASAAMQSGGHGATRPSSTNLLGRVQASPSTRRLAAQLGVDIAAVRATGDGGRVTEQDVRSAASAPASLSVAPATTPTPQSAGAQVRGASTTTALVGIRRSIAAAMTEALAVPDIMEFREIDATDLLATRDALAARLGTERMSVTPLLLRATVLALREHPGFNARFDASRGEVTQYQSVHLGIATATDDGLMVPVLHDADSQSVDEIVANVGPLVAAAKSRTATSDQLGGGTFTVTNFGSFGTWLGTPIIRVPEVAIAGFGRIAPRALVVDGEVVARPVLPIVVAADHRVNDGAHLGAFVSTLERLILSADGLVA